MSKIETPPMASNSMSLTAAAKLMMEACESAGNAIANVHDRVMAENERFAAQAEITRNELNALHARQDAQAKEHLARLKEIIQSAT